MNRPTRPPHHGTVAVTKSFQQAYQEIGRGAAFTTNAGTPFTAEAGQVKKGRRKGQQVIIFRRGHAESARAYECCWGHATNCNRTYIDSYTQVI